MCTIPIADKARAAANAAQHVNIFTEAEALEACIANKKEKAFLNQAQYTVNSVLLPAKWAKIIKFLNASNGSNPSMVSIGSSIDQFDCKNGNIHANVIDINNLSASA
jgi:hypothetical protein